MLSRLLVGTYCVISPDPDSVLRQRVWLRECPEPMVDGYSFLISLGPAPLCTSYHDSPEELQCFCCYSKKNSEGPLWDSQIKKGATTKRAWMVILLWTEFYASVWTLAETFQDQRQRFPVLTCLPGELGM